MNEGESDSEGAGGDTVDVQFGQMGGRWCPSLQNGLREEEEQVWEEGAAVKSGQAEFGVGHPGQEAQ